MGNVLAMRRVAHEPDNVEELIEALASRSDRRLVYGYVIDTMPDDDVLLIVMTAFRFRYRIVPWTMEPIRVMTFERQP